MERNVKSTLNTLKNKSFANAIKGIKTSKYAKAYNIIFANVAKENVNEISVVKFFEYAGMMRDGKVYNGKSGISVFDGKWNEDKLLVMLAHAYDILHSPNAVAIRKSGAVI